MGPYDLMVAEIRSWMTKSAGSRGGRCLRRWRSALAMGLNVILVSVCGCSMSENHRLDDSFTGPDGLVATSGQPSNDPAWMVTSGSLFRSDNVGWTGRPDDGQSPDGNGSAVFRMVSKERSFADVTVRMRLRLSDFVTTDRTP